MNALLSARRLWGAFGSSITRALCGFASLLLVGPAAPAGEPCRIEIVEKGSGWPVPLVELRTTNFQRFVSDNAGMIACDSPELLDREVWFDVIGHGYGVPKDGFGMRGVRLAPKPGATLRVEVSRQNIARRLGRLTGAGLFADSQKVGQYSDVRDQGVFGCDSVQNAVHRGRLFWAWGDTLIPNYKLGIFAMTSATTAPQPLALFEPPLRLKFDYFTDAQQKPKGVAAMPGEGPTWLSGYVSLPDATGAPHLVASYIKVRNHLEAYESGLCVWNEEAERFDRLSLLWTKSADAPKQPPIPDGHPTFWKDLGGKEWVYFGNPLPLLRCPATFESWQDPQTWEVLTPQRNLPAAGSGESVQPHSGSIAWNSYRKRWVTVFLQNVGKPSVFGEVWYAEAPAPSGPWGPAIKILTHENYTFYNPRLHPEFTAPDSPILIFEGTYTAEFANHAPETPRYNYNQILYRLDLDDSALAPAMK